MKARFFNDVSSKSSGGLARQSLWGGLARQRLLGGSAPTGWSGFMRQRLSGAFTILELMTAITILVLMVGLLSSAVNQASKAWTTSENRVETFTDGRAALDFMARELSQTITTNTIPFLAKENSMTLGTGTTVPITTLPLGNVAFVASVGDGASDGMDLMEVVYRLSQRRVGGTWPLLPGDPNPFTDPAPPYKLVRRISPYSPATGFYYDYGQNAVGGVPWDFYGAPPSATWPETSWRDGTQVLAENVISLRFQFEDDQSPPTTYPFGQYYWNSTTTPNPWLNELGGGGIPATVVPHMQDHAPSRVIITLTMLDSRAAERYKATSDQDAKQRIYQESQRTFTTSVYIPHR